MSNRIFSLSIVFAAAGLASPLVLADQDGFRTLPNDGGTEFVCQRGTVTRKQVKAELEAARRDGTLRLIQRSASLPDNLPRAGFVSSRDETRQALRLREQPASTGWRYVGGEAGWTYEGR